MPKGFALSYLKVIQLELGWRNAFLVNTNKKKKGLKSTRSLIDFINLFDLFDIQILYIDRTANPFSRAVRGENFLYVSRGGAFFPSIPMSRLSNRCN